MSVGQQFLCESFLVHGDDGKGGSLFYPSGGLCYYLRSLENPSCDSPCCCLHRIHAQLMCIFSKTWINVSGSSAKDVSVVREGGGMELFY